MDVQRVDGLKYDLDRLTENELEGIHGHLLEQHARIVGEVALIEHKLFARRHDPIPFEEEDLNGYGEIADPATWQAFTEATRDA